MLGCCTERAHCVFVFLYFCIFVYLCLIIMIILIRTLCICVFVYDLDDHNNHRRGALVRGGFVVLLYLEERASCVFVYLYFCIFVFVYLCICV